MRKTIKATAEVYAFLQQVRDRLHIPISKQLYLACFKPDEWAAIANKMKATTDATR